MLTLSLIYVGIVLVSGMLGCGCRLRVAAHRLATESIDSPAKGTRWTNRYLFFSFWHLFVSLFSLAFMLPVMDLLINHGVPGWALPSLYLLLCLPLASVCYCVDLRLTRRCDPRKRAGRLALRKRLRGS
ncbi:hypothetical protein [Xanthomonas arboricola]|uniref:hypothetical protein n=1 Tax=Xanthomonas arboricola TaxID=56448 RepID=UPI000CEEE78D|nr:hypothetical protein [Xanthomonas arboricola]PPT68963.1 hypothetical protein XarbCFBP8142_10635 [Xanthomonas arboricola]